MPPSYSPGEIDDANLAYYYSSEPTQYGLYYTLKFMKFGFPNGFYASERDPARQTAQQPQSSGQAVAQQQNPPPTSSVISFSAEFTWSNDLISAFRIAAHGLSDLEPGPQLRPNHWSIYLLNYHGTIQLDMVLASFNSNHGALRIQDHRYKTSGSVVRFWDIGAKPVLRAGHVHGLIRQNRRDQYYMVPGGFGSRWWVLTVMRDFVAAGFADTRDVEEQLVPAMNYGYSRSLAPIPLEMEKGTFA